MYEIIECNKIISKKKNYIKIVGIIDLDFCNKKCMNKYDKK